MAVQGVNGSIDILLQYTDNLDTLLSASKQKITIINQTIGNQIADRVDLEKQLKYYLDLGFDGRKKENKELQAGKKLVQEQLKHLQANTKATVQQAQAFALAGGELASIRSTLAALRNGEILAPSAITKVVKDLRDLQAELATTGSLMNQLQGQSRQPMIKTYGSTTPGDTKAASVSMSNVAKTNMVSLYDQEQRRLASILQQGQAEISQYYEKIAAAEKKAGQDFIEQANMRMKYERELAAVTLEQRRKRASVLSSLTDQKYSEFDKDKQAQDWYNKTYIDVAPVTKYKEALARLGKEKDLGRITTEQYSKALDIENKRLSEGMKALNSASDAQAKLNKQTAEQRATSFTREYESTPALNKYNDALGKLNSLKDDGIISSAQYASAVAREKAELESINTTAALTNRQRAEGFRVIDGETRQLKGLTLQWHDFRDAMRQTDGGSTFGKKLGTTAQYMAAGTAIYGVVSAFQALGQEIAQFDTFTRTAAAAMDMTHTEGVRLGEQLLNLAGAMGGTNAEIQGVAMELGRAGVSMNDIVGATEVVMRMARLTGDTFAESTKAIVAYQTVFGNTYSIEQLGDKLATVANVSRLTTHDIGTFSNYALAASQTIGMSIDTLGALAAAFSNAGTNASTSGTSVRRFGTMLMSTDKEVVSFFDSLGVNQANMLAKMNSGIEESNRTMIGFLKQLSQTSDEEFQKMISGMDILAANTLTMMRNNADEITRLIKVSQDESAGMLANTNIILESYQVSWERIINNIKNFMISMFNDIAGKWLPRTLAASVDILNKIRAQAFGTAAEVDKISKDMKIQSKVIEIEDATEAGDLRKVAILKKELAAIQGTNVAASQKTLDATKVLLQTQLQSLQVERQSGSITEAEYQKRYKNLQLSFQQANAQKTTLTINSELFALHDKQYAQALQYIKLIKAEKDPGIKKALQAELAGVQGQLLKTQSQIKGVVDQTSKLNAAMGETGGTATRNNQTLNEQVSLFKSSAGAGIALKTEYDGVTNTLREAKTNASDFSKILADTDLNKNVKNQVEGIIKSTDSTINKANKLSALSKTVGSTDKRSANIIDSVVRGYKNVLEIEKQIVDVNKAWDGQNNKKVKGAKRRASEAQKEHDYTLEMHDAQAKQQELIDALNGKEISAVQIAERKRDIALTTYTNAAYAAKTDKDNLDVKLKLNTYLEAELSVMKAQNSETDKTKKYNVESLKLEQEIKSLKSSVSMIYVSDLDIAKQNLKLAQERQAAVEKETTDAHARQAAEKEVLQAKIKVNDEIRKQHEIEQQLKRDAEAIKNEYDYTKKSLTSTIELMAKVKQYDSRPTSTLGTGFEAALSTLSSGAERAMAKVQLEEASTLDIFKHIWGQKLDAAKKANDSIIASQDKIIASVVYEAQAQDRAIQQAQDKVKLTDELLDIQNRNQKGMATEEEINKLILNGNRSQVDLEKEKLELQKAQNDKLKTQAGIINELYAINMKDNPIDQQLKYRSELAKIKEQMKGVEGWSDADSQKVALERSKNDWDKYVDGMMDTTTQLKQATQNAFSKMEDSIVEFTKTGKFSFKDFAESVMEDLYRIFLRSQIVAPLAQIAGGIDFSSWFSSSGTTTSLNDVVNAGPSLVGKTGGPIPVKKYAYGGKLYGGTGFKDDLYLGSASGSHVFAMGGEYILNRQATQSIGSSTLDYMNKNGSMPDGGGSGAVTAVVVNIENKSGQAMTAEKMSEYTRQNSRGEQEKVINFVIDGVNRNINGARDILKGLR